MHIQLALNIQFTGHPYACTYIISKYNNSRVYECEYMCCVHYIIHKMLHGLYTQHDSLAGCMRAPHVIFGALYIEYTMVCIKWK